MHDVAVALDDHHVGELDGAVLRDAADVVAAEVHEHHVFGALLGIGEQLFGEQAIFLVGLAAAARASQRANRDAAVDDANHDLRRAADERDARRAQVEHERAGIHDAERAIDFERRRVNVELEALADYDLEDVAGADVLDAFANGVFELLWLEVRAIGDGRIAAELDVDRCELRVGAREAGNGVINTAASVVVSGEGVAAG